MECRITSQAVYGKHKQIPYTYVSAKGLGVTVCTNQCVYSCKITLHSYSLMRSRFHVKKDFRFLRKYFRAFTPLLLFEFKLYHRLGTIIIVCYHYFIQILSLRKNKDRNFLKCTNWSIFWETMWTTQCRHYNTELYASWNISWVMPF